MQKLVDLGEKLTKGSPRKNAETLHWLDGLKKKRKNLPKKTMSRIYIAWSDSETCRRTFRDWDWENNPVRFLCSFVYLKGYRKWEESIPDFKAKTTMLDSGAFSAWKSGYEIDIDDLIKESKEGGWDETVALDVIGDYEGSKKNAQYMASRGSNAFPVFHYGEPWSLLEEYCERYDKVGISCRFGEPVPASTAWVENCFAKFWPHKFHSFGWVGNDILRRVPFHSADTASWQVPVIWGRWTSFKGMRHGGRGGDWSVRSEIEMYLKLERELESRWRKTLSILEK